MLDQRQVNKIITPCAYPVPLCDEYRKKMATGNTVFSTLDLASGYHQVRIDTDSVDNLFGFRALVRIFVIGRLSMGWSIKVGIFQRNMDSLFKSHKSANPYLDDLGVASKLMDEKLDEDFPKAFAICSRFNVLLKGSKADLAKAIRRVLGYEVGRSKTRLSCEKRDKIIQMKFPTK